MSRSLFLIIVALFMWGIGEGMFYNFTPIYLAHLGGEAQQIGWILGAFGAAMTITHLPAGWMADRWGRRPMLIAAWVIGLLATVVMAWAERLWLFTAGLLLYGMTAFVASPLSSYVTTARGSLPVGRVLSLITASFSLGMIFGPLLSGWLGQQSGLRTVYMVAAGWFALSTMAIVFIEKQPIDEYDPAAPPPALLENGPLWRFLGVIALATFAMFLPQPLTPNFLEQVRGLPLFLLGVVFSANALGNVSLSLSLGRLSPRLGYLLAQGLVGLFALLIWQGQGLRWLAVGYFFLGGFRAARPLALAQVRALIHASQMGVTYGTIETIYSIIFIVAAPLAGFLFDRDPYLVYPISIGLIVFSMLVTFLFAPRPAKVETVIVYQEMK